MGDRPRLRRRRRVLLPASLRGADRRAAPRQRPHQPVLDLSLRRLLVHLPALREARPADHLALGADARLQLPHGPDRGHEPDRPRDRRLDPQPPLLGLPHPRLRRQRPGHSRGLPPELADPRRGGRHPADRGEQRGGRCDLRRPPARPGPPGGPLPEPAGAGDPHPSGPRPLPAHAGAGAARGSGRHAAPLLRHGADEPFPAPGQARPGRGIGLAPDPPRAAGGAGCRHGDQADLRGERPLPPDPLRPERTLLHPLQVPHDGRGRRGAPPRAAPPERDERAGVQAEGRSAGDRAGTVPPPLQPGRAAAVLERAARRHEPGGAAPADPGRGGQVRALAAPPPGDEARHDLPLADQRPEQPGLPPLDGAGPRVHRLLDAAARSQDPGEDDPRGAVGPGVGGLILPPLGRMS